jgi:hypothetical protein
VNIRQLAEADLAVTLEDEVGGFGWPVTITDPAGVSASLSASSGDIAQVIDPDTGQPVSGRLATAVVRISSVYAAGFTELPRAIANTALRPWVVQFDDINGRPHTFKVSQSNPDRTLGMLSLILEAYTTP